MPSAQQAGKDRRFGLGKGQPLEELPRTLRLPHHPHPCPEPTAHPWSQLGAVICPFIPSFVSLAPGGLLPGSVWELGSRGERATPTLWACRGCPGGALVRGQDCG